MMRYSTLPRPFGFSSLLAIIVMLAGGAIMDAENTPGAPGVPGAPDTADLQPKFVAGRTTRYEIWSQRRQHVELSFLGESKKMEMTLETKGEVTWTVDRVGGDGSATCTMTLDWLVATTTGGDAEPVTVDSRKAGGDDRMSELLKAMARTPITVEVAADGTVKRVRGVDAIHAKLADPESAPDELDFQETASDLVTIAAAAGATRLKGNWKTQADWNHELGKLHHDTTYTLQGIEQVADISIATIEGVSKLRLDVDPKKLPADGPRLNVQLKKGEAKTQIMFDLSRGEAVGRNSMQSTTIEAKLTHNGQTLTRLMDETIQSQVLRIAEK